MFEFSNVNLGHETWFMKVELEILVEKKHAYLGNKESYDTHRATAEERKTEKRIPT